MEHLNEKTGLARSRYVQSKRAATALGFAFAFLVVADATDVGAFSFGSFFKTLLGLETEALVERSDNVVAIPDKPFPFLSATPQTDYKQTGLEIVDDIALTTSLGPMGNVAEAAESNISYKISTYTVRDGDSLGLIAHSFGVSVNTITWANNIPRGGVIRPGQQLVILPVSGVRHVVKAGDTAHSIAKKYGGNVDDVMDFNDLLISDGLVAGATIIVPDGELAEPAPAPSTIKKFVRGSGPELLGYFLRPLIGGIKTQGIHGYNGVDIANPIGSAVRASASGTVIVARSAGWNGGYGQYVVISHPNGTQTLYAHLSGLSTSQGTYVSQGETIGYVGSTGKSTGPHLHFEIRGAKNPF